MAQDSETLDRYDLAANGDIGREDLMDIVYNISPTEVPFQQNIGRGTAYQDLHEWIIDSLAAADSSNAHIDGDNFDGDPISAGERLQNYNQILRKDIVVSRRANVVRKAGRRSELAYQIAKAGKELRRDSEAVLLANQAARSGNSTLAPLMAGLPAWVGVAVDSEVDAGNTNRGALGADPALTGTNDGYPNVAATDGTQRALNEDGLLEVIKACYINGGDPNMILVGPTVKQQFSKYMFSASARIATPYQDHGARARDGVGVVGAVDVYVSDFGVLDVVPDRFMRQVTGSYVDAFVIDTEYAQVSYLDGYKTETISKVGDAERRHILVDETLCIKNPAAHGVYADIDDSLAMTAS